MRNIILTEEQVERIINEELGIANEVIRMSENIEKEIYDRLDHGIDEDIFSVGTEYGSVNIDYMFKSFDTADDFAEWYSKTMRTDGYSFDENTIRLTVVMISGYLSHHNLSDTIQHECSHYWECMKKGKSTEKDNYGAIVNGTFNTNPTVAAICNILYCSDKNEINAFVNGTYAEAMKKRKQYKNYSDFIKDNRISDLYGILKKAPETLDRISGKPGLLEVAMVYMTESGIIRKFETVDKFRKHILKTAEAAMKLLIRKIGNAYALYVSRTQEMRRREAENKIKNLIR